MAKRVVPRFKQRRRIRLKEWREYRGMTQQQLADAMDWSVGNISQLERGLQGYSQEGLEALAAVLRCDPGQLINVDPLNGEIWSIWESAQQGQRQMILEIAKTVTRTGTEE